MDGGTVRDDASLTRKVARLYRRLGWRAGKDLLHYEEAGGQHNERYWRGRVWRALTFLFGQ
jgi:enterochelin esterase-like enzyme